MKKLKLQPGAFNGELLNIIGTDKVGWNSDDHQKLTEAILPRLNDEDGKGAILDGPQRNILELILRPTEELQRTVLKETFVAAGYELDENAAATYELLFNAVQFADYLYKTNNPTTNKPFVAKPPVRGKKATLNKLLAEKVTSTKPEETAPVQQADAPVSEKQSTKVPPASVPDAEKKPTPKPAKAAEESAEE